MVAFRDAAVVINSIIIVRVIVVVVVVFVVEVIVPFGIIDFYLFVCVFFLLSLQPGHGVVVNLLLQTAQEQGIFGKERAKADN